MRYTEEQIIDMLNKCSGVLNLEDILELIKYKNEQLDNARANAQELYDYMRERQEAEVRIALRMGYLKGVRELFSECDKIKRTDYPVTNSVHMEDVKAIVEVLEAKSKDLPTERFINVDELCSKFAGHSDYHGDAILSLIQCMAEGKQVDQARPMNTDVMKFQAIMYCISEIKSKIRLFHYLGYPASSEEFKYAQCVEECDINDVVEKMRRRYNTKKDNEE